MNLQVFHGTALLASPAISFQNPDSEFCVLFRTQFEPRSLLTYTRRIIELCIIRSIVTSLPALPLPENQRKSSPGNNPVTCLSRASTQQFRAPLRSHAAGFCTP